MSGTTVLFESEGHRNVLLPVFDQGEAVPANQHVVVHGKEGMILDPGGHKVYTRVLSDTTSVLKGAELKYIFLSHQDPDIVAATNGWLMTTDAVAYTPSVWKRFIPHFGLDRLVIDRLKGVPDQGMRIDLGGQPVVRRGPPRATQRVHRDEARADREHHQYPAQGELRSALEAGNRAQHTRVQQLRALHRRVRRTLLRFAFPSRSGPARALRRSRGFFFLFFYGLVDFILHRSLFRLFAVVRGVVKLGLWWRRDLAAHRLGDLSGGWSRPRASGAVPLGKTLEAAAACRRSIQRGRVVVGRFTGESAPEAGLRREPGALAEAPLDHLRGCEELCRRRRHDEHGEQAGRQRKSQQGEERRPAPLQE